MRIHRRMTLSPLTIYPVGILLGACLLRLTTGTVSEAIASPVRREANAPTLRTGQNGSATPRLPGNVALSGEEARSFYAALNKVARQAKLTIVAEGTPVESALKAETATVTPTEGSATQIVAQIAAAFDYQVVQKGGGANRILLQKRYARPGELPCVTMEELAASVHDLQKILAPFAPDPPIVNNTEFVNAFAKTLSREQVTQLEKGELSVASLSPEQKREIARMSLNGFTGLYLEEAKKALAVLDKAGSLDVGWKRGNADPTADCGPVGKEEARWPLPSGGETAGADALQNVEDDSAASDRKPIDTLSALAGRLSARNPAAESVVVDKTLGEKPVTVFGEEYAAASEILQAVRVIYGLRIIESQKEGRREMRLTRLRPSLPVSLDQVQRAINASVPLPLYRALGLAPTGEKADTSDIRRVQRIEKNIEEIHQTAATRLTRTVLSIKAISSPKGVQAAMSVRLPVSKLNAQDRAAFALAHLREYLRNLNSAFGDNVPPGIAHWEESVLQGGPYEQNGKKYFDLTIRYQYPLPGGGYEANSGGIGGVEYRPESE